jgi:hypothetical protein
MSDWPEILVTKYTYPVNRTTRTLRPGRPTTGKTTGKSHDTAGKRPENVGEPPAMAAENKPDIHVATERINGAPRSRVSH